VINSMERMYRPEQHNCKKTTCCVNADTDKCANCVVGNEVEGWLMYDHFAGLQSVGATIDGIHYPVISGWFMSKQHGLVSKGNYLGTDGEEVYVPGCGSYFKVVLPTDRKIEVFPV
jgi:hypothetical protein